MASIIGDIINIAILAGFTLLVVAGFMGITVKDLLIKIKDWWGGNE